jgi:hypothetical protein
MDRIEAKSIGVFGVTSEQFCRKMAQLTKTLPQDDISHVRLSIMSGNCIIDMKNGDRYIGLIASENARGYRWKQVYVPYNVNLEIFQRVIRPKLISNLPEHEQVIGYWL